MDAECRRSTEMKDDHGVIIHEGDKVKCTYRGSFVGRVVFYRGCFMVYSAKEKKEKTRPYIRLEQYAERSGFTCTILEE